MTKKEVVLVVSVDRDNDLGRKTGIDGPVIGEKANLEAAKQLALADPGESDANCIFAALKKLKEAKEAFKEVEIITLTGRGKSGFYSDQRINEQLDLLEKKFKIKGFVLVSDGAEDDQVIPILQSRAKILSKETLIVKQAREVESIYFTIKETLMDPYFARVIFGIPGIILLGYAVTLVLEMETLFLQGISFVIGAYLLMKGFGIETKLMKMSAHVSETFSLERISFPFYIGSVFIFAFGIYAIYSNLVLGENIVINAISALEAGYVFLALSALCVITGKAIDAVHFKKAFHLRKHLLYGVSILLAWFILDAATLVFLGEADLNFFLLSILISFAILLVSFRATESIDIRKKITKLMLELPIYNIDGTFLGKVTGIDEAKKLIVFTMPGKKGRRTLRKGNFAIKKGKIVVTQSI